MCACTPFLGMQSSPVWCKSCMHSLFFMHACMNLFSCMHASFCACTLFVYAWTCMQMCQITCMMHACIMHAMHASCRHDAGMQCMHGACMHHACSACMHSLEGGEEICMHLSEVHDNKSPIVQGTSPCLSVHMKSSFFLFPFQFLYEIKCSKTLLLLIWINSFVNNSTVPCFELNISLQDHWLWKGLCNVKSCWQKSTFSMTKSYYKK